MEEALFLSIKVSDRHYVVSLLSSLCCILPHGFHQCSAAYSERHLTEPINVSTSLPLETVDENSIAIHKGMRLLKPVEATDTWQQGRRYLIAPAALASCPLTVVNKLSGTLVQTAAEATNGNTPQAYGAIDLGEALITYVGEKHHLSLGKWSSCRLALRQKYLLEFDCSTALTGLPRGFAHLEHAIAYPHADFPDALELQFYASPCAKSDQRVVSRCNKCCRVSSRQMYLTQLFVALPSS